MAAALQVVLVTLLVAAVSGQEGGEQHQQQHLNTQHHEEYTHNPEYNYGYGVHDEKTKDVKKHSETRKGDRTEGEYSFLEADGTTRTVKYYVDGKSGFVATVTHSGHAVHPQVEHKQVETKVEQPSEEQPEHHQQQTESHKEQPHQYQVVYTLHDAVSQHQGEPQQVNQHEDVPDQVQQPHGQGYQHNYDLPMEHRHQAEQQNHYYRHPKDLRGI